MISLLCEIKKTVKFIETENIMVVTRGSVREKWGDVVKKYKVSVKHNKF